MKKEYFEIVVMLLKLLLLVMSVWIVPQAKKYIESSTTKEQRENALFGLSKSQKLRKKYTSQKGRESLKSSM